MIMVWNDGTFSVLVDSHPDTSKIKVKYFSKKQILKTILIILKYFSSLKP